MSSENTPGISVFTKFSERFKKQLPTAEWVESRFELLKRTALPSLNQQSQENFVWLISSAPEWHDKVRDLFETADVRSGIQIVISDKPVPRAVIETLHTDSETFITAKLDSDDTLERETLSRLAVIGKSLPDRTLIDMPNGAQLNWNTGELMYMKFHKDFQGPFLAVKHDNRDQMFNLGGVVHRLARPRFDHLHTIPDLCWMRVIHGGNLVNRFPKWTSRIRSFLGLMPRDHFMTWTSVPQREREQLLAKCGVKW
jgi:hypothetical protein